MMKPTPGSKVAKITEKAANKKAKIESKGRVKAFKLERKADKLEFYPKESSALTVRAAKVKSKTAQKSANVELKKNKKLANVREVTKNVGIGTREIDGKPAMVREKSKTITKGGLTKKTVVKGKGLPGSGIGRYKEVKTFK